tara:strand:- start:387 stop:1607 length:1221 start_codon:yes stop_codon:yes gene_type:complete
MNFLSCFLEACNSLRYNSLRTFLTILGVVIGVSAVIVMLAVGRGVETQVNKSIASIGSDLLVIFPGFQTSGRVKKPGSQPTLTLQDSKAISTISMIDRVAPVIAKTLQIQYRDVNTTSRVSGVNQNYHIVRDWELASGYHISEQDIRSRNRVAVIGNSVAKELFGDLNAVNKIIKIRNVPFNVIGVLQKKGTSITGRDQDNSVFVPFSTARQYLIKSKFPSSVSYIIVKVSEQVNQEVSEREIKNLLRERHQIKDNEKNDFNISNLTDIASSAASATKALTVLLASIAGVSLLVGGIGIMNIMLVGVTERTREIGVRLAIGAKEIDILNQFLIEAVIICLLGGIVGIMLGISFSWLIARVTDVTVEVTITSVLLAFFISALIGVFFGWYPAKRASKMQPVDALRIE